MHSVRRFAQSLPTALLAVGVIAAIAFLILNDVSDMWASAQPSATHFAKITVAPGDTLWAIAGRYTPDNTDTQAFVGQILAANPSLSQSAALTPGMVLKVPQPAQAVATSGARSTAGHAAGLTTHHRSHHSHRSAS